MTFLINIDSKDSDVLGNPREFLKSKNFSGSSCKIQGAFSVQIAVELISSKTIWLYTRTIKDECCETVASGGVVDTVYLDFQKAFDTVSHRRLIGKLEAYCISKKY